jgi:hypothetical protein
LKRKLESINKSNVIGMAIFRDVSKKIIAIKNKSVEIIKEEAYTFLELDHPHKVELKKKGLHLPFNVHDKDYN